MSFTDTLKRSLGFEESESSNNRNESASGFGDFIRSFSRPQNVNQQANRQQNFRPRSRSYQNPNQNLNPNYRPYQSPVYDDYDYVITPEQSFYEIILVRPKTIDDINYIVDQVIEEKNPVILDLSFLEKESPANFKLVGEKIKQMRSRYGAQALLLSRSKDKDLLIVSPNKVKIINRG